MYSGAAISQTIGWDSNYQLPGLGRDDLICFTMDEIVFVGTGNHGGFGESNKFYAINTRNGSWSQIDDFPGEARQYASVEVVGFNAYVIGGYDQFGFAKSDLWKYDLIVEEWIQLNVFPGEARWKAASFVLNETIYYGTGLTNTESLNDFWKYDVVSDVWTQLTDAPFLPRNKAVSFELYDQGFIGLGIDCTGVLQDDIWSFNPLNETWSFATIFPGGPRFYAISEVLNGRAYVGTGQDALGNMHGDFWEYDLSIDTWNQVADLPNPKRRGAATCAIPFKAIYVACGLDENFNRLQEISRFTIRNLNPPPLQAQFNSSEQAIYINNLPGYSILRIVSLQGDLVFESYEKKDHFVVATSSWSKGLYIVWANNQTEKVVIR